MTYNLINTIQSQPDNFGSGTITVAGFDVFIGDPKATVNGLTNVGRILVHSLPDLTTPVCRFNDSPNLHHFYTASTSEENSLINNPFSGYTLEGISFGVSLTDGIGLTPVYRFYNPISGDHFYTANASEENSLINNSSSNYNYEGIGFYAYGATSNISRFYSPNIGDHFYTGNLSEVPSLLSHGWVSEGVAFKAAV